MTTITPFNTTCNAVETGKCQTPDVTVGGKKVGYISYQLAVHHFNLKLMAAGMKFRGISLKQLKQYYGLTGRSAKDCLAQFEIILNAHKQASSHN